MKKVIIIALVALTIFLRLYNLSSTARFTRDESSDLLAIKNIIDNRKITLIGPMDEGKIEVFSSLTYYLLLPFCIIFGFSPVITAYGTAFYGIFTVILLALVIKKTHWSYLSLILTIIFTPLLISSRWAWNPYFIHFWQALSLLILFSNFPYKYLFTGILMGLTIHQHWYAIFTVISIFPIIYVLHKNIKLIWHYSFGIFLTLTPFIIFDLTHPPGLFITRMLYFSPLAASSQSVPFFHNLWINTSGLFRMFSGNHPILGLITLVLTIAILISQKNKKHIWLLPLPFQIIGLSLTHSSYHDHYLLSAVVFYLFWLYSNQKHFLTKLLTVFLIFSNLLNLSMILNFSDWTSNINAQQQMISFIAQNQLEDSSFNLVVLQSPDNTTKGLRFKDQLKLINISIKDDAEYRNINTLYVISYQSDWSKLSKDPAYEIDNFNTNLPIAVNKIPNSDWYVYKLSKNK